MIALGAGGVLESVARGARPARTTARNDPEALAEAVAGFDPLRDRSRGVRRRGAAVRHRRFQAALRAIVDEAVAAERGRAAGERPAVVTGLLPRRAARRAAAGR